MELAESLKEFVESGQDWERKNTSVKGVYIIRLPQYKNRAASLAIDINPNWRERAPHEEKRDHDHECRRAACLQGSV